LAKLQRCVVFGTTSSASKVEYLRTIGVDHVLVGHGPGLESAYRAVSPSRPLDVVFDLLGGATVRQGLRLLGPGGRIVCCGVTDMMSRHPNIFHSLKTVLGSGLLHPVPLMLHSKGVIGMNMLRVADANQAMIRKCLTSVIARAVSGVLEPQVGGVFPIDRLAEAHAYLEQRRSTGKIAVHW
jgi:NADPH:quinone reductase-like Zn-dependent oxidoreductase